jgi:hypothetical protein
VLADASITIHMENAPVQALPCGPATTMWTYDGSFPGRLCVDGGRRETGHGHGAAGRRPPNTRWLSSGSFLSGVAVKPGEEGTTEFELEAGTSYTLICRIPDSLSGDFVPHIVKGMYIAAFTAA